MTLTYLDLPHRLAGDDDALRTLVAENLEDNEQEMLPTLVLYEIQLWAVENVGRDRSAVVALVARVADEARAAKASGAEPGRAVEDDPQLVLDAIIGSFLDGLPVGGELRGLLPDPLPQLLALTET